MAKQSFQMLYALKATVRRFEGSDPTVAIIVGYKDAKSGNRVYRGLDDPWVTAIIDAVNDDVITKKSLADAEDKFEIELDAPVVEGHSSWRGRRNMRPNSPKLGGRKDITLVVQRMKL